MENRFVTSILYFISDIFISDCHGHLVSFLRRKQTLEEIFLYYNPTSTAYNKYWQ